MAKTCRDIVTRALRMASVISRDEDPAAEEMSDGLFVLQSLYMEWLTTGMFGRLKDVYETGDYEAGEGQRIFSDSGTVTLPATIDERKPRDLVAIEAHDATGHKAWIWDRIAWVRIDDLEPGTDAPLGWRGANGLAAVLAVRWSEEFGANISSAAMLQARNFTTAIALKMGSERDVVGGEFY